MVQVAEVSVIVSLLLQIVFLSRAVLKTTVLEVLPLCVSLKEMELYRKTLDCQR
jgi:hypothetical protein